MDPMQVWVSPADDGNWRAHVAGKDHTIATTSTQAEAIDKGRDYAKKHNGELIIQGMDGQIRDRYSYGDDPYPPKG